MKVKELIQKLKTLPQEFDVEFANEKEETFDIIKVEITDNTNDKIVYMDGRSNCR